MEIVEKFTDAALMFWQSLDTRERLLITYAVAGIVALSWIAGAQRREQERENRIVERLRNGS